MIRGRTDKTNKILYYFEKQCHERIKQVHIWGKRVNEKPRQPYSQSFSSRLCVSLQLTTKNYTKIAKIIQTFLILLFHVPYF